MAVPPARPKPIAFVCVVRFATPPARNAFYAPSGQAGQGAEVQARKMLAARGICDVELVTWVQPRAKAAKAANAAARDALDTIDSRSVPPTTVGAKSAVVATVVLSLGILAL